MPDTAATPSRTCRPRISAACFLALLAVCLPLNANAQLTAPEFREVTVHDPSVVRHDNTFYVFGSHLASASTTDLIQWTQLSTDPVAGNPLAPNPTAEFQEALAWVGSGNAFWAPDVIRLPDGRFAYYYCIGRLDQPRAALGLAFSNSITGPYTHEAILLRSGPGGQPPEAGATYDARIHPNTVDPALFYDKDGKLWMVYGSYSGGIFILEMDAATGHPLPGQGYGKKLIGGNHARIEGGYVLYHPESDYYYLFVSYGGLGANDGYNIRLGRSRSPDGPYVDAAGTDLATVAGAPGSLFDDASIAPHGVKLMGGYQFLATSGEPQTTSRGYRSPGHNSAVYDAVTGRCFLIFHTRFVGRGEQHEVRVHQMHLNADDWLLVAPHRHAGENAVPMHAVQTRGMYKLINHGKGITSTVATSTLITLQPDGTITGTQSGTWTLTGTNDTTLTLDGVTYRGVFLRQWDDDQRAWTRSFTALSDDGVAIWGTKVVAASSSPPAFVSPATPLQVRTGSTVALTVEAPAASEFQWRRDGIDIVGATKPTLILENVTSGDAGAYTAVALNSAGFSESEPITLSIANSGTAKIYNLSVRTNLSAGSTLIVGFAAEGSKSMLLRAAGPSLAPVAPGLTGLMPDPRMALYEGQTQSDVNDNWTDWPELLADVFASAGAFPFLNDGLDSALRRDISGARTAHVQGPASGIVLVEAYDTGGEGRLINVSARNQVGIGDNVLIAGFTISGTVAKTVLIRGLGPRLTPLGVAGALTNPVLSLHDASDARLAANDDWDPALAPLAARTGAAGLPLDPGSRDACLLVTLNPGSYTAIVSGVDNSTGEALVEIYEVP